MSSAISLNVPAVCVSTLGSLVFLLGLNVSRVRNKVKVGGPIPIVSTSELYIASRNHGNATEYIPTIIALIIWIKLQSPYPSWVDYVILGATASRVIFAGALLTTKDLNRPTLGRRVGAAGTYFFGTALAFTAGYLSLFR